MVLIHGGFWRSVYTKSLMSPLARDVAARGWAAWNIEYRRVGGLGHREMIDPRGRAWELAASYLAPILEA